jgi:subtilisin family serine protease
MVGPSVAQEPTDKAEELAYIPGEILVKFRPHVRAYGAQASLFAEGLHPLEMALSSGVMRVQVPLGREAETIASLLARGDVAYATFNHIVQPLGTPNDPGFSSQWALHNTGQAGGTPNADIDAPEAWDIFTGGDNITIAIIDSGVDTYHEDLIDNIWHNSAEVPANGIDDDGNGYIDDVKGWDFVSNDNEPFDDYYHGTHVAGTAAARGNNGKGGAGVSWAAKIMPLKAISATGGSILNVEKAIDYAVANGADIINMSLGQSNSYWNDQENECGIDGPSGWSPWPQSFGDALDNAVNNNVLIVVAAGNDGQGRVNCPGAYDQVMAVGSTTMYDERSTWSSYGLRLDISAPGGQGLPFGSDDIYSTVPTAQGSYGYSAGTSMSTPYVAGLAALVWSIDPTIDASQIRDHIQNSADDLVPPGGGESCSNTFPGYVGGSGWDPCFGYGRINARRTLLSFSTINLQETSGLPLIPPLAFLADNEQDPLPAEKAIQVAVTGLDVISWTATISPSVSWLSLSPPTSGVATSSIPDQFTVAATKPASHGTYATTIVVSGTNSLGTEVGSVSAEVYLYYVPELLKYRLPLLFKN